MIEDSDLINLSKEELDLARLIVERCIIIVQLRVIRNGYDSPEYKRSVKHIEDLLKFANKLI